MDILEIAFGIGGWFLVGSLLLLGGNETVQPYVLLIIPFLVTIGITVVLYIARLLLLFAIWVVHCMMLPSIPFSAFLIFLGGILVQTVLTIHRLYNEVPVRPTSTSEDELHEE